MIRVRSSVFLASLLGFVVMVSAPASHAGVGVTGVGGYNLSSLKYDPAPTGVTFSSKGGFGGGALIDVSGLVFGFEAGALVMPYGYKYDVNVLGVTASSEVTQSYIQVPVLLRFNLLPVISVGAGGYYATAMGKTKTTSSGVVTESDPSGDSKSDYGLVGSVNFRFHMLPTLSFVSDFRYTLGLKNHASDATTQKFNNIQVLAGFRIGI